MNPAELIRVAAARSLEHVLTAALNDPNNYVSVLAISIWGNADDVFTLARAIPPASDVASSSVADSLIDMQTDLSTIITQGFHPHSAFGTQPLLARNLGKAIRATGIWEDEELRCYYQLVPNDQAAAKAVYVIALAHRPASGGLSPACVRECAAHLEFLLRSPALDPLASLYESTRADNFDATLRAIAELTHAEAVLPWRYDMHAKEFHSIGYYGPDSIGENILPLGGVKHDGITEGIVSLVRPERPLVIYDEVDPAQRLPQMGAWRPHNPAFLENHGWTACVAWPVTYGGDMYGAISIYAQRLRDLCYDEHVRTQTSFALLPRGLVLDGRIRLRQIEDVYDRALAQASTGSIALEYVHDFPGLDKRLQGALNALNVLQLPDVARSPSATIVALDQAKKDITLLRQLVSGLNTLAQGGSDGVEDVLANRSCDVVTVITSHEEFLRRVVAAEHEPTGGSTEWWRKRFVVSKELATDHLHSTKVPMDEFTLLRVVLNLLRNAAWWARRIAEPKIELRITPGYRGDRSPISREPVVLAVVDNGPGIGEEDIGLIFDRGVSRRGGSGLGLHTVRNVVQRAGGEVRVWSRPGSYTLFRIKLPAVFR